MHADKFKSMYAYLRQNVKPKHMLDTMDILMKTQFSG